MTNATPLPKPAAITTAADARAYLRSQRRSRFAAKVLRYVAPGRFERLSDAEVVPFAQLWLADHHCSR